MADAIQLDLAEFLIRLIEQTPEHDAWSTLIAIKRIAQVNLDLADPAQRTQQTKLSRISGFPIANGRSTTRKDLTALARSA